MRRYPDENKLSVFRIVPDRLEKAGDRIRNEKWPRESLRCFSRLLKSARQTEASLPRRRNRCLAAETLRHSRVSASNDALRGKGKECSCRRGQTKKFLNVGPATISRQPSVL